MRSFGYNNRPAAKDCRVRVPQHGRWKNETKASEAKEKRMENGEWPWWWGTVEGRWLTYLPVESSVGVRQVENSSLLRARLARDSLQFALKRREERLGAWTRGASRRAPSVSDFCQCFNEYVRSPIDPLEISGEHRLLVSCFPTSRWETFKRIFHPRGPR